MLVRAISQILMIENFIIQLFAFSSCNIASVGFLTIQTNILLRMSAWMAAQKRSFRSYNTTSSKNIEGYSLMMCNIQTDGGYEGLWLL